MRPLPILLAVVFVGCNAPDAKIGASATEAPAGKVGAKPAAAGEIARKVVVTSSLDLSVTDLETVRPEVERLTLATGGYIAQSESNVVPGSYRSTSWTLRIPEAQFAATLDAIAQLGTATRTKTDSDDVTAEYIDVQARIDNLKKQQEALARLLAATKSDETVMKIHESMAKIGSELDSALGRRKYLDQAVALATLKVTARESSRYTPPGAEVAPGFGERASRTLSASARGLVEFGVNLALFCVALVPWLPLILLLILITRWGLRRLLRVVGRRVAWLFSPAKPKPESLSLPFPEVQS